MDFLGENLDIFILGRKHILGLLVLGRFAFIFIKNLLNAPDFLVIGRNLAAQRLEVYSWHLR